MKQHAAQRGFRSAACSVWLGWEEDKASTLCAAFAVAVLVAFSVPAFAGSHHKMRVRGTVESVDPAQKTFVVKDRDGKAIPFRVDDRSEFELEHRDKPDQDVPFTELKTGDRVKVKAFKGEPPHLVDDVDIYR